MQNVIKIVKDFIAINSVALLALLKKYLTTEIAKRALIAFLQKSIGAAGPIGFAVRFFAPKLIKWGVIALTDLEQTIKDDKVADEFKEELAKPEVDKEKRAELEKDILTGK